MRHFPKKIAWARHLTILVGLGGRAFARNSCTPGPAFNHFFQIPGVSLGRGGMLVAGSSLEKGMIFKENLWNT